MNNASIRAKEQERQLLTEAVLNSTDLALIGLIRVAVDRREVPRSSLIILLKEAAKRMEDRP